MRGTRRGDHLQRKVDTAVAWQGAGQVRIDVWIPQGRMGGGRVASGPVDIPATAQLRSIDDIPALERPVRGRSPRLAHSAPDKAATSRYRAAFAVTSAVVRCRTRRGAALRSLAHGSNPIVQPPGPSGPQKRRPGSSGGVTMVSGAPPPGCNHWGGNRNSHAIIRIGREQLLVGRNSFQSARRYLSQLADPAQTRRACRAVGTICYRSSSF